MNIVKIRIKKYIVFVDQEDFEYVSKFKWHIAVDHNTKYAYRSIGRRPTRSKISMHRDIMKAAKGSILDHINGNGLDNRKQNLRFCTVSQNRINTRRSKNKYKGTSYKARTKKWYSTIQIEGRSIHLGCFLKAKDAARAYDEAAKKYHGEFARLNFPECKCE